MKKLIAIAAILLSLVSEGSWAQTKPKTLQSFAKVTPSLNDSIFGSHIGANRNFQISDLFNLNGPRTETLSGKTMSGSNNTFSNIPESAITNLVTDLTTLTTTLAGKANTTHTHTESDITGLVSDLAAKQPLDGDLTSLAAASGTNTIYYRSAANTFSPVTMGGNMTFSGGVLNSTGSGGGSASNKQFSTVSYSSTINIDFSSSTNYSINATGDISFTNSNVTSGSEFIIKLVKNTSSNINITFPSANWTAPSINNEAPGMATSIQTTPPGFTLSGSSGSVYSIYIKHLDLTPTIYLNFIPNFYEPSALATNIIVWDGQAAFVDPGNTTAETSVYQTFIPAGVMKAKSKVTVKFREKRANSGGSGVRIYVRAGTSSTGTANSAFYNYSVSNNGIVPVEAILQNSNSTSSQVCDVSYHVNPANYSINETTLSIPTASGFYIDILVQKTVGTDTGAAGMIEIILSNI